MNTLAFTSSLGSSAAHPFQLCMLQAEMDLPGSFDSDLCERCTWRQLAEAVVRVLPKAFVMCKAKSAALWSLVTRSCTSERKSSAAWGENSAKGDSLLNVLQLKKRAIKDANSKTTEKWKRAK